MQAPVKINTLLIPCLLVASCGGSKSKKPTDPMRPPVDEVGDEVEPTDDDRVPDVVDLPPAPKRWEAEATLAPVKGIKLAPAVVTLTQTEGDGTRVMAELEGLKPGTYHLAIHTMTSCGKNATRAGAIWDEAAGGTVSVTVAKGSSASLDTIDVPLMLDGEASIVGHALVLHADKKGKPGKAVACGEIASANASDE